MTNWHFIQINNEIGIDITSPIKNEFKLILIDWLKLKQIKIENENE